MQLKFLFYPFIILSLILGSIYFSTNKIKPNFIDIKKNGLDVLQIQNLILNTEKRDIQNTLYWSKDIKETFNELQLEENQENVCSVVAIIYQESTFNENPLVSNLSQQIEKKIEDINKNNALDFNLSDFLQKYPSQETNYYSQIQNVKTEKDVDIIYRKIITEHSNPWILNLFTPLIENMNKVDTIGSMQVAVAYAITVEEKNGKKFNLEETWKLRDYMYSRKGGVYYGTHLLLKYPVNYDKKIYRFADFNAGQYSSRNASIQEIINKLLPKGESITQDGDLLSYNNLNPLLISETEKAMRQIIQKYNMQITNTQLTTDLLKEKELEFENTMTYKAFRKKYKELSGKSAPYAILPSIKLHSEKTSRILSTEHFANNVNKRYKKCMSISIDNDILIKKNSKGMKIYCLSDMSICKTKDDIAQYYTTDKIIDNDILIKKNSKGMKIYCLSDMSICKTKDEIISYIKI